MSEIGSHQQVLVLSAPCVASPDLLHQCKCCSIAVAMQLDRVKLVNGNYFESSFKCVAYINRPTPRLASVTIPAPDNSRR